MNPETIYESLPFPGMLADLVLLVHAGIVAFVVVGQLLFIVGGVLGWRWVRQLWVRSIHLIMIGIVVLQAWLGRFCPLTIWEYELRRAAGQSPQVEGFVEYWVGNLLFHDLPGWVFVASYTAFGLLVLWSWWWLPPQRGSSPKDSVR